MVLKALSQISENERAEIVDACGQDLQAVEALLSRGVRSASALSEQLAARLVAAGGKRIRPYLLCLSYHSFRADQTQAARASREDLQTLAAVAEWVHTATLFHDDVLDASPVRRDQASAHML
ncbi:MAG: polyprenyl synthetase family protein, partial [Bdellovibrionales bacterium]|nr:polyprenyl synthetase family protein [Bdellovibrionales bacterium]